MKHSCDYSDREFSFKDADFRYIQNLVGERTGIVLSDMKRTMVYSRVVRRIRKLGLKDFKEYCDLLRSGNEGELILFTNAITTNLTSFFRESHHFDYLLDTVFPEIEEKNLDKRIRIWSAGCSSGEEPYSIAMTLNDYFGERSGWDIKILATDLDHEMIERASAGIYSEDRITGLDIRHLRKYVKKGKGKNNGLAKMNESLRSIITFKQLNLLHEWPFSGEFDAVFCRNVVIYFSKDTQKELFDRYADVMKPNAPLFIGHSESLFKVTDRFKSIGKTIYRKVG